MACHGDEVKTALGLKLFRRILDPVDPIRPTRAPRNLEHRRRRINANNAVPTLSIFKREQARAAAKVEDILRRCSRQAEIEIAIFGTGISQIIQVSKTLFGKLPVWRQYTTTLRMLFPSCIRSNALLMSSRPMTWVIIGSIWIFWFMYQSTILGTSVRPFRTAKGRAFPGSPGDQLERPGRDFLAGLGDADNDARAPSRDGSIRVRRA